MSVSSILLNPLDPNEEPETWSNLNVNSVNTKSVITESVDATLYLEAPQILTDDIIATSSITVPSVITSDIHSHTIETNSLEVNGTHFIGHKSDFDKLGYVSDGVIYLHDYESYYFTKIVDIGFLSSDSIEDATPYRIECGEFCTIRGNGLESSGLRSTGLSSSDYIVNTNHTITINDMSFHADPTIDQNAIKMVSSDGTSTADWKSVNFYSFGSNTGENTMLIDNFDNCIFNTMGFLSSSNLVLRNTSGNFGTISFADSIFVPKTGGNSIVFEDSFNCTRRFRVTYSAFVALGDSSMIISSDATFPIAGHILDTVSFGGFSTPNPTIVGMTSFNKEAMWDNNTGINNTAEIGELFMIGNTSDTIIGNTTDFFDVAGSGQPGQFNERFTVSDTDINYIGSLSFPGKALVSGSLSSGNNNQIDIAASRNGVVASDSIQTLTTDAGGRLQAFSTFYVGLIEPSDTFNIVVRNDTAANNILVDKLHVLVNKI